MCRGGFKNGRGCGGGGGGGLRKRPLPKNCGFSERPLAEKKRGDLDLKIQRIIVFKEKGVFRRGQAETRGSFGAI